MPTLNPRKPHKIEMNLAKGEAGVATESRNIDSEALQAENDKLRERLASLESEAPAEPPSDPEPEEPESPADGALSELL